MLRKFPYYITINLGNLEWHIIHLPDNGLYSFTPNKWLIFHFCLRAFISKHIYNCVPYAVLDMYVLIKLADIDLHCWKALILSPLRQRGQKSTVYNWLRHLSGVSSHPRGPGDLGDLHGPHQLTTGTNGKRGK